MDNENIKTHIVRMKRAMDKLELGNWVSSVGGIKQATRLISQTLECSKSKAEKIAGVRYPSNLTSAEQLALSVLTARPRDVLFPEVRIRKEKAS